MRAALLALALAGCAAAPALRADEVTIPAPGVALRAGCTLPPGAPTAPAIIGLHGCGGPFPARDDQWRDLLVAAGHAFLAPDSFGSRGLGSQCRSKQRRASPGRERRSDTAAAVAWLNAQPGTPPGGVVVMGWSNGGSTVLAAAREGAIPHGQVRGFVAMYPGCKGWDTSVAWAPSAPLLIVMGADDDWTPAAPCQALAARFPDRITLVLHPGAYHDFDAPNRLVTLRTGLAYTAHGDGEAHVGTNEPARQASLRDVPAWIAALPAAR
jgi:dienelactone hydrolase